MFEQKFTDNNSEVSNYEQFKPKSFLVTLHTPKHKSINDLKKESKKARQIKMEKWLTEENYIPKIVDKHNKELLKKD